MLSLRCWTVSCYLAALGCISSVKSWQVCLVEKQLCDGTAVLLNSLLLRTPRCLSEKASTAAHTYLPGALAAMSPRHPPPDWCRSRWPHQTRSQSSTLSCSRRWSPHACEWEGSSHPPHSDTKWERVTATWLQARANSCLSVLSSKLPARPQAQQADALQSLSRILLETRVNVIPATLLL